jgi:multidrug efflux pump subunit AcrA (membrane-fusion protein)
MQFIKNTYSSLTQKYGKNRVIIGLVLLSIALIYLGFSFMGDSDVVVEEAPLTAAARTVSLYTISAADDGTAVRTADGNAFIVRAESGGRVERMAKVGDTVARGAIVAQVENSAQRAAVLQAQGAYEAAKAGARASDVGSVSADRAYDEALTQAVNAYRTAFATSDNVLRNTVDQVFSQPDSQIPGLKIDGGGQANKLGQERVELETRFTAWKNDLRDADVNDAEDLLDDAEGNTTRLSTFVVTLTSLLADDDQVDTNTATLSELRADFATARATLNGALQSLSGARSALITAKSAKEQAEIAASRGDVSLADAQVKQALGVLESARAALNKTAIKTPVAGTVTAVSISVGDIISIGSDVVFVASDAPMEMGTEDTVTVPLTSVKFTPSKAYVFTVLEGKLVAHEVETGSVTTKSIAISGAGGVDDIVLDVRGLKDGDAVVVQ